MRIRYHNDHPDRRKRLKLLAAVLDGGADRFAALFPEIVFVP
jgi:hypothetical protein